MMKNLVQITLVAFTLMVLFIALSVLPDHPAAAATAGPGVTIAGPLPLPVNVQNFPSTQPVSGTVSVANFPTSQSASVSNASSAPLFVREVDSAAHHPFVMVATCTIAAGTTSCAGDTPTVTPNFKEFVIETVSGEAIVDKGLNAALIAIVMTNGTLHSYRLPLNHSLSPASNDQFVTASPGMRIYSDGGQVLEISFARDASPNTTATADVVFSGYTVDCGQVASGCPVP
jgi:hypothetical protein